MSDHGDDGQMDAFARFLESDHALRASLAIGAWLDVEQRYNGGGYGGAYAAKLEAAAALYSGREAPSAPRVLAPRRPRHRCRRIASRSWHPRRRRFPDQRRRLLSASSRRIANFGWTGLPGR